MPLFNLNTPAAGIFGKARNQIASMEHAHGKAVPEVEAFEADFVSYLNRLESSASSRTIALGHDRKQLSHS